MTPELRQGDYIYTNPPSGWSLSGDVRDHNTSSGFLLFRTYKRHLNKKEQIIQPPTDVWKKDIFLKVHGIFVLR